jgi:hypothetical protein
VAKTLVSTWEGPWAIRLRRHPALGLRRPKNVLVHPPNDSLEAMVHHSESRRARSSHSAISSSARNRERHLVLGGCFGRFEELGPDGRHLSMRHIWSTAAVAACSVSPRWRLSVTASLPRQRGGRPSAWISAAERRSRPRVAAGYREAAGAAAFRSARSRSSVQAPRGRPEP